MIEKIGEVSIYKKSWLVDYNNVKSLILEYYTTDVDTAKVKGILTMFLTSIAYKNGVNDISSSVEVRRRKGEFIKGKLSVFSCSFDLKEILLDDILELADKLLEYNKDLMFNIKGIVGSSPYFNVYAFEYYKTKEVSVARVYISDEAKYTKFTKDDLEECVFTKSGEYKALCKSMLFLEHENIKCFIKGIPSEVYPNYSRVVYYKVE